MYICYGIMSKGSRLLSQLIHILVFFFSETHPCASAICPIGSVCRVYIGNSTNTTYCQPSCEIDNGGCKRGERCSLIKQTCFLQPCPPQVECSKYTPLLSIASYVASYVLYSQHKQSLGTRLPHVLCSLCKQNLGTRLPHVLYCITYTNRAWV